MTEQANLAVVSEIYNAFGRGDVAAVLNQLDEHADLFFEGPSSIPWAGTFHGRAGWGRFFQTLVENVDAITLTMTPFAAQGDHVVVAGRYSGRARATGAAIDSPLVHLWTLRGGKVVRCEELTNTAAEAAACGASGVATAAHAR